MKFAISYISFFDNEIHMEIIEAVSYMGPLNIAIEKLHGKKLALVGTSEEIKQFAFDTDSMVEAIYLPL